MMRDWCLGFSPRRLYDENDMKLSCCNCTLPGAISRELELELMRSSEVRG